VTSLLANRTCEQIMPGIKITHIHGTSNCTHGKKGTWIKSYQDEFGSLPTTCQINGCNWKIVSKSKHDAMSKEERIEKHVRIGVGAHVFKDSDILARTYILPTCSNCNKAEKTSDYAHGAARMLLLDECTCWRNSWSNLWRNLFQK